MDEQLGADLYQSFKPSMQFSGNNSEDVNCHLTLNPAIANFDGKLVLSGADWKEARGKGFLRINPENTISYLHIISQCIK